jgi:hypothetical protein
MPKKQFAKTTYLKNTSGYMVSPEIYCHYIFFCTTFCQNFVIICPPILSFELFGRILGHLATECCLLCLSVVVGMPVEMVVA